MKVSQNGNFFTFVSDVCENRHKGSSTSVAANKKVSPFKREIHEQILAMLKQRGPMTRKELADALNVPFYKVTPRVSELLGNGDCVLTGAKREDSGEVRVVR